MNLKDLQSQLFVLQDQDADVRLLRDAIGHESVTGNEAAFSGFLTKTMNELNL